MDDLNPAYKKAREAYAGPTESKNAIAAGRGFMRGDIEDQEKLFDDLTPGDREFFVTGIAYELKKMATEGTSDTVDATRKILAGRSKSRLKQFLGPAEYDELLRELKNEATTTRTMRPATGGSHTGPILGEQADAAQQEQEALGFLGETATLGWRPAAANLFRKNRARAKGLTESSSNELSNMLRTRKGDELSLLRDDLKKFMNRQKSKEFVGKSLLSGGSAATYNLLDTE